MIHTITKEWEITKTYIFEVALKDALISLDWNDFEVRAIGQKITVCVKCDEPMAMKKYRNYEEMEVLGTTFNGVKDIWEHAISSEPNNGIYVAEESEHYPCFDSSDYAYENRYFCSFIFSRGKGELAKKLKELKAMRQLSSNYNKLTQTFHPMTYWEGDKHHEVYITEGE